MELTISKDEFLKRVPSSLHPIQRIALEGISFALDSIIINYNRVIANLSLYQGKDSIVQLKWEERVIIFSDLWSLIDQAHMVNQLLNEFSSARSSTSKSIEEPRLKISISRELETHLNKYRRVISSLRNKMDHLHQNLKNLSNTTQSIPPLYGALSYVLSDPEKTNSVTVVALTIGALTHDKHTVPVSNPCGKTISMPIGCLQMAAFDQILDISELYKDIVALKEFFNKEIAEKIEGEIKLYADKNGLKYEDVLQHKMGSLILMVDVAFPE